MFGYSLFNFVLASFAEKCELIGVGSLGTVTEQVEHF